MSGDPIRPVSRSGSVGKADHGRPPPQPTGDGADRDVEFVFDSRGSPIAVRIGRHLVDPEGGWLGWVPWNDGDAFDPEGRYLGTITPGQRFYEIDARRGLTSPPPTASPRLRPPVAPSVLPAEAAAPGMRDARIRRTRVPSEHPAATSGGTPRGSIASPEADRPVAHASGRAV